MQTRKVVIEPKAKPLDVLQVFFEPTPGAAYIDLGDVDVVEQLEQFEGRPVRITIEALD